MQIAVAALVVSIQLLHYALARRRGEWPHDHPWGAVSTLFLAPGLVLLPSAASLGFMALFGLSEIARSVSVMRGR